MIKKRLWLDVDGVLNSAQGSQDYIYGMEVSKLKLLKQLIEETACYRIVSTTDRRLSKIEENQLTEVFDDYGLPLEGFTRRPGVNLLTGEYIDDDSRGFQILDSKINLFNDVDLEVIIDDNDDKISEFFPKTFIQVNRFYGLNDEICNKVKSILGVAKGDIEELFDKTERFLYPQFIYTNIFDKGVEAPPKEIEENGFRFVLSKDFEIDSFNAYEFFIKKTDQKIIIRMGLLDVNGTFEELEKREKELNLKYNFDKKMISVHLREGKYNKKGLAYLFPATIVSNFEEMIGYILDTANQLEKNGLAADLAYVDEIDEDMAREGLEDQDVVDFKNKIKA